MLVIGLTGGIASGKSSVAEHFADRGVPVIDADILARQMVEPGQSALSEIVAAFGTAVLTPNGRLNRGAVRALVFDDPVKRHQLEAILHPRIRRETERQLRTLKVPYCILVIPLLLEAGQQDLVDRILVVDAPESLQLERLCQRDSLSESECRAILAAQLDRATRNAAADDLIVNDADLAALDREVERLHRFYLNLAANAEDSPE